MTHDISALRLKKYLQGIGATVEISKGEATAALRHRWGLNNILAVDGLTDKNREDHRHHAIDAITIALTSRRLFQKLSRLSAQSGKALSERGFYLDNPWQSFYTDVCNKIEGIIVSHAPSRKISGALHEETAYGYSEHEECFVYRKPLSSLTANEVEKIRDAKIKQLVEERLAQFEGNLKKAFGDVNNPLFLPHKKNDGKTPIKSARIKVNLNKDTTHPIYDKKGNAYKYFKYGNNHHVEIIENVKTGKRKGVFVTAMEAAKRARRDKTAIVQKDHGQEWKFIMSLAINDMVEIEKDNRKLYYRVQLLDGSNENIAFRLHIAARLDDKATRLFKKPNILQCKKIAVDPLGSITPCND